MNLKKKKKNIAAKYIKKYPRQKLSLFLEMPLDLPHWDIWKKSWWVPGLFICVVAAAKDYNQDPRPFMLITVVKYSAFSEDFTV